MKEYTLKKSGALYYTKAAVKGATGIFNVDLLIDTGATYTILPVESLVMYGYDIIASKETVRLIAASGFILAPKIKVEWIHALGCKLIIFSPLHIPYLPKCISKVFWEWTFSKKPELSLTPLRAKLKFRYDHLSVITSPPHNIASSDCFE